MNIKEVLKNIARSILKDELIELDNQIINLTDLNINQSEQIEELSIELTRLTNQDKSADEIYYTTKYPEEKITYTRTDKLGTHEIDVIDIKNVGANPVYIQLNDTATTNHFKLEPEDVIQIGLKGIESLSAICDSGKTSTLNIIGN